MLDKLIKQAQQEFSDTLKRTDVNETYQLTRCESCGKIFLIENDKVYCREYFSSENQCCECFLRNNLIEDKDDYILVYHEHIGVIRITSYYCHLYAIHLSETRCGQFGQIDIIMYEFKHYLHFFIGV